MSNRSATGPTPPRLPDGLTARAVEVLCHLAAGETNQEIAAQLVLSARTVERHVASIFANTDARRRVDATVYAMEHDILPRATPADTGRTRGA